MSLELKDPLLRHRPDRARHDGRIGSCHRGGRRARGARARGPRARHAGRGGVSLRRRHEPGALDSDGAAVRREATAVDAHRRGPAHRRRGSSRRSSSSATTTSAAKACMAAAAAGARTVLEVNAPVIDHAGSAKAAHRPRAHRRADAPVARAHMRARRPHRHAERRDPPAGHAGAEDRASSSGAPTRTGSARTLPAPPPFERPATTVAIFAGAFRSWHGAVNLVRAMRELHARGRSDVGAVFVGDGPELPAVQDEAADLPNVVFTGAVPHADMPACLAAADIGVAPFDVGAHRPLSLGFYWSPLKIFEYMAAGLPVVAPAVDRIPSLVAHGREGLLYDPAQPGALAPRAGVADRPVGPKNARPRRPGARRPGVQLEGALRGARQAMRRSDAVEELPTSNDFLLRTYFLLLTYSSHFPLPYFRLQTSHVRLHTFECVVLLATDSFPPMCGGSGWSTYELARGLRALGHDVIVAQPRPGTRAGSRERDYDGLHVIEFGFPAPPLPYVRNYFKNERLYPALADALAKVIAGERIDLVHGQHVLDVPAGDSGRAPTGPPGRLHRSRLLARVLLVRPDSHARGHVALSGMLGRHDDALRPPARRRGVAAGAADDSLHARQPSAEALGTGRRGRHHRGQHDNRAPISARARRSSPRRGSNHSQCGGRRSPSVTRRGRRRRSSTVRTRSTSASSRRTRAPRISSTSSSGRGLDWPLVIVGDGPDRGAHRGAGRRSPGATCASWDGSMRRRRPPGSRMPRC